MSRHKFASNVCEKALVTADPEMRRLLIDEMMAAKQDGVVPVVTMMKDQFASKQICHNLSNAFLLSPRLCSSKSHDCR